MVCEIVVPVFLLLLLDKLTEIVVFTFFLYRSEREKNKPTWRCLTK